MQISLLESLCMDMMCENLYASEQMIIYFLKKDKFKN